MCVGGHETRKNVRCHVTEVSCGKTCGKLLPCGEHVCRRACHSGACQPIAPNTSCGQLCGAARQFCEHTCHVPCHPGGTPCPAIPCKQAITIYCPCKRRSGETECG